MSVPILLLGTLQGVRAFIENASDDLLIGRSHWVSLLPEVLPRALIAELGLSKMLLGSSGGGRFLVVLPEEVRPQAEEFLNTARADIHRLSGGALDLVWAITEYLGDWTVLRKRLNEDLLHKQCAPLAATGYAASEGGLGREPAEAYEYLRGDMTRKLRDAATVGWSPEFPGRVLPGEGKHTWSIGTGQDAVPFARHAAPTDEGSDAATPALLGQRAEGYPAWGILRGDVDSFLIRIRRAQAIEEHVQLSVLYKQFFAGELEVLCSMEFWRKVTLLYSGGDDFAVVGAWDALIGMARELQRLFHRFSEEHLKDFPGPEGKTITMAIALAPELDSSLAAVFNEAGRKLDIAKSTDKDCLYLFGRTLEWRQVSEASDLKDSLTSLVTRFGTPPEYIGELAGIYRESRRSTGKRVERPWRIHNRIRHVLGGRPGRDFGKARTTIMTDLVGKNSANMKLRPSGRVALEWARLATETAAPVLEPIQQED